MNNIIAKNYLCFYALLEMLIADVCPVSTFTQEYFAELFGVTIPFDTVPPVNNVRYSSQVTEYGACVDVESINTFMNKAAIPLCVEFVRSNYFDELTLIDLLQRKKANSYIIFAFCYGILYNDPYMTDVGHVALLQDIIQDTDSIRIYDPGPRLYGCKTVSVDDMMIAMKRRGGLFLFERTLDNNEAKTI